MTSVSQVSNSSLAILGRHCRRAQGVSFRLQQTTVVQHTAAGFLCSRIKKSGRGMSMSHVVQNFGVASGQMCVIKNYSFGL